MHLDTQESRIREETEIISLINSTFITGALRGKVWLLRHRHNLTFSYYLYADGVKWLTHILQSERFCYNFEFTLAFHAFLPSLILFGGSRAEVWLQL